MGHNEEYRQGRTTRRVVLVAVPLAIVTLLGWLLPSVIRMKRRREASPDVGDLFVSAIKLGEEVRSDDPPEAPIGYARAYEHLAPELQARLSYETFYQGFLARTREHGPVVAGERVRSPGRRKGGRGETVYRLLFGDPQARTSELAAYDLILSMRRLEGRSVVGAFELLPADLQKRP